MNRILITTAPYLGRGVRVRNIGEGGGRGGDARGYGNTIITIITIIIRRRRRRRRRMSICMINTAPYSGREVRVRGGGDGGGRGGDACGQGNTIIIIITIILTTRRP